ncbi:MAG: PilZ domain-containing protein [Candidatus Aminicenantes bacterium]|nr:PilZ domain-containing protein [Candidatus Aminicenantes bacterium]MDH5705030.1 PilZ domain-containing protein [Candidatus Aminicenantes bacterium]
MEYDGKERKRFKRLKIPRATVNIIQRHFLFYRKKYSEEFCPVVDLSRGGVRFLCRKLLSTSIKKISLQIYIPGERSYLNLKGRIKWISLNPMVNYKYQVGVQFNPFGGKKDHNRAEKLKKIIELEKKFLARNKLFAYKNKNN